MSLKKGIIIFGPQGSGKGTQAELLSKKFGSVYIASGNIFRQEIEQKTKLGKAAEGYIRQGRLVPDSLTIKIIQNHLNELEVKKCGFILDGFPRNQAQMRSLETMARITDVVVIDISDQEAVFRIGGRLSCVCGKTYHTTFNPPKNDSLCDACGRKLETRKDDTPASIRKRLSLYHKETEAVFSYYEKKGILKRINGEKSIPEVYKEVLKALDGEKK